MNTDERLGTFRDIQALFPPEIQKLTKKARAIILDCDPDTFEVPRFKEKTTTYGVGPGKMKEGYIYLMPQKEYLNLGFYQAVDLYDPENLLEGTGKRIRHVKIRSAEQLESPPVINLIRQSVEERRKACGILK